MRACVLKMLEIKSPLVILCTLSSQIFKEVLLKLERFEPDDAGHVFDLHVPLGPFRGGNGPRAWIFQRY